MNGLFVILLIIILFFLKDNFYFLFALISLGLILGMVLICHGAMALHIHGNMQSIRKNLSFPLKTENSSLVVPFSLPSLFFMMKLNLRCSADSAIFFKYDKKRRIFYSFPFYHGLYETAKYTLEISDFLSFFTFSYVLPKQTVHNFFSKRCLMDNFVYEAQALQGQKSVREDTTLLFRDYLNGDDVRTIVWRIYALTEELKVKIKWKEISNPKINIFCSGLAGPDPFFTELVLYKMCSILYNFALQQESVNGSESTIITINSSEFDVHDFEGIQKQLFSICNEEKNNIFKIPDPQSFVLCSVFSKLRVYPKKSLFIPIGDFFSIDGKKYAAVKNITEKIIGILYKKPFFMKYTDYYFSHLYQKEQLFKQ